jgi:hypothetical protein
MTPGNGNGWKTPAIGALWAILLLLAGWFVQDSAAFRSEITKQIGESTARIAVLEEANRNIRESLARIEAGVARLSEQQQERRR